MTASRLSFWLLALSAPIVALVSLRFLALGLDDAFPPMAEHLLERRTVFLLHVAASPVALLIGAVQFMPRLRARRPGLHRWMGRIYALAILVGGLSGLVVALGADERPWALSGFSLLAVLWLATTAIAVRSAMRRDFAAHRVWMIRSFALTFAAVTLRVQLGVMMGGLGMDYTLASAILAWSCWVPNLIVAELLIRSGLPARAPSAKRRFA